MKELLSICIPTYNRCVHLKKILDKILKLCVKYNIQVFVSDNASTDETQLVCSQYLREYSIFHYYRNETNIGPDNNFEFVIKQSNTKYRWLLSDTCYFENLNNLIEDLSNFDFDVYVVNGSEDRAKYLPHEEEIFDSSIIALEHIGWHLSWISCMIYNEKVIKNLNFKRFSNSSFNQTGIVFESTANRKCFIKFNPNVIVRHLKEKKESEWNYRVFDIFYRDWYMFVMSLPVYYPYASKIKCIHDCQKKSAVLSYRMHAKRRSEGKWSYKDIRKNHFFITQSGQSYIIFLLMSITPHIVIKSLFLIGHIVKKIIK